ncbi:hydrogenase iron-sulfur subunit [Desulfococcaceae bacterium HSG8]|nr:hydrogenase iron-sulfur subunit [Desulfococcaceae bacterium HSG8]
MTDKTLVIGNGPCARSIAEALITQGAEVIVATKKDSADISSAEKVLSNTKLVSCQDSAGSFNILMNRNGEELSETVGNVVIAEEAVREPDFSSYELTPSPDVISLSRLTGLLSDGKSDELSGKKIVFLTGLAKESSPVILEDIMQSCLRLQSNFHAQTYILTKNLKVGGNGLEALYRTTREAGAVYVKFTDVMPEIRQEKDTGVALTFTDEITGEKLRLSPDITVVDERIFPSEDIAELAALLELDTDQNGFVQADNVHRISVLTNRKGIFAAGPSRSIHSPADQVTDAGNAVISVLKPEADQPETAAQVNKGLCVRCLTCYRVCPYRAIILNARPFVVPEACEQCGICTAECPAHAVTIKELTRDEISDQIIKGIPQKKETTTPFLVAFCCRRSAVRAKALASCMGHTLPRGLRIIEVPCAGGVSHEHIFSAFQNHADGVLVLTCHEGNCHSERGNIHARKRTDHISGILSETGFESERLLIRTLASNMAKEFADIVNGFEKTILDLGPSSLSQ